MRAAKNSFGELIKTLMVAGSIAIIFRSVFRIIWTISS